MQAENLLPQSEFVCFEHFPPIQQIDKSQTQKAPLINTMAAMWEIERNNTLYRTWYGSMFVLGREYLIVAKPVNAVNSLD